MLVAGAAAPAVGERFRLEPLGDGTYRVQAADPAPPGRGIRTILVTDIVGSTRIAERVGDRAWTELVAAHERATRDAVAVFGGAEVATTGDGLIASFDSPGSGRRLRARADRSSRRARAEAPRRRPHGRGRGHDGEVRGHRHQCRHPRRRACDAVGGARQRHRARARRRLRTRLHRSRRARARGTLRAQAPVRRDRRRLPHPRRPLAEPAAPTEFPDEPDVTRARRAGRLVAGLYADAETAGQLYLSMRTVNAHLRSIYRKVGVRSRAAAGRFAAENGLI